MTFYIVGRLGTQIEEIATVIKNIHDTEHIIIPTHDVNCITNKQTDKRDIFFIYVTIPTATAWNRTVTPSDDYSISKFVDDQIDFINHRFEQCADYTVTEDEPLLNTAHKVWDFIEKCVCE